MLDFIIEHRLYIGSFFELLAALSGSYYLFKTPNAPRDIKYFAWFLWYVFILDNVSFYALWAFFDDYKTFPFLKDSLFTRNIWVHNWNHLISISFYCFLFIKQLNRLKYRRILKYALITFTLFGTVKLASSKEFFFSYDMYILIIGVLLLVLTIFIYYFELIISDKILEFKKNIFIYISVGLLIWHLCVPPIQIYSAYFSVENVEFIKIHSVILRYCNIFLYGMFSFGFIYRAGKTSYSEKGVEKRVNLKNS